MISVLMLTYNRENLVSRAIESVLAQTYKDFEFINVDNGSDDKSGDIAESYAEKGSRIKAIHREHGNIGMGRNTALDAAKGECIAFDDDDDWTEPDFLEEGSFDDTALMYKLIASAEKTHITACLNIHFIATKAMIRYGLLITGLLLRRYLMNIWKTTASAQNGYRSFS